MLEWDDERRLQRAAATASLAVAGAAVVGAARIHLADPGVDVELVAHRLGNPLGLRPRAASPTTIDLVAKSPRHATGSPVGPTTTTPPADRPGTRTPSTADAGGRPEPRTVKGPRGPRLPHGDESAARSFLVAVHHTIARGSSLTSRPSTVGE